MTHEGSHREVFREFQTSYNMSTGPVPRVGQTTGSMRLTLHCPMVNSVSTQSQQSGVYTSNLFNELDYYLSQILFL